MSKIDVVVVCWNDKEKIATALDSVFALTEMRLDPDFAHVVVSDNGSSDGSRAYIAERYGGRVQIVENGANLGFAAACNRAFAATSSEYVFLLNPDAELKDHALAEIVAFLDEHPRCGIAGSRIYNYDGSVQQSIGAFDTWTGAFLRSSAWGEWPLLRRFANGAALRDYATYDTPRRVDLAIGAAHEEVDFARRAADAGWETWFVPASEAVHEGMGSARGHYSVEGRKQSSRRKYWIKHHGYVWYWSLVGALVGRYALYAGVVAGAVIAGRRLLR